MADHKVRIAKGIGSARRRAWTGSASAAQHPHRHAPSRTARGWQRVAPTQPPSPDPARTYPPGHGPKGPAPTAGLATSRGVAWRATGSRGDSHRGGRQPAHGNRSRAPRPSETTGRRAQSAGVAAGRHLDSWRAPQPPSWRRAVGLLPGLCDLYWKPLWGYKCQSRIRAVISSPSREHSSLLAAHTAPVRGVNTFHFKR